ncbi:MAG: RluA family pseudouridine synthase [Bdellovibrionota bacterium]|jgi:23S rRNA pseudouridine1911/1915/1917 synthase
MSDEFRSFNVTVGGERLDLALLDYFSDETELSSLSRSQLKNWIEAGRVTLDQKKVLKAGTILKDNQVVTINVPVMNLSEPKPLAIPLDILYEDDDLLAINKQAGLSMHPGAGPQVPTLLNGLCHYFQGRHLPPRSGIVHRLDKDTTGVVLVAKNVEMQTALVALFAERRIKKTYAALVFTTPRAKRPVQIEDSGEVITRMGRHPKNWRKMAVLPDGGKEAITSWQRLESLAYATLLDVVLKTGRTHQIRVHMDYLNSPLIGDRLYGDTSGLPLELKRAADRFGRQALHAKKVEFEHPLTHKPLLIEAQLPTDFEDLLTTFRSFSP